MPLSETGHKTRTPVGLLEQLDLNDADTQRRVLGYDKHQILEGLVFEEYFVREVCQNSIFQDKFKPVLAQTAIVVTKTGQKAAFVLVERKAPGLGQYLSELSRLMPTWFVEYHTERRDFFARRIVRTEAPDATGVHFYLDPNSELLNSVCARHSCRSRTYKVKDAVRDEKRQNSAFWGGLYPSMNDNERSTLVQGRIFLNYCMTENFHRVWNVDKVYASNACVWVFEIKHKSPMYSGFSGDCSFGLNVGEVENMRDFAVGGLRNMHIVIVKPRWERDYTTQAMFMDNSHRNNTVIVGRTIDYNDALMALKQRRGHSGAHTTLTGEGKQEFCSFSADSFHIIGMKSDTGEQLASGIRLIADGNATDRCSSEKLLSHRIQ